MKLYKYKGKIYCEEDISLENKDYAGDLWDLYWELKKDGKCNETTVYYTTDDPGATQYDSAEELVEKAFNYLLDGECERSEE